MSNKSPVQLNQDDYIHSLENLLVFMCQTHKEWTDELRRLAREENNEALYQMPIIQGMDNSIGILQLADMKFEKPEYPFFEVAQELKRKKGNPQTWNIGDTVTFDGGLIRGEITSIDGVSVTIREDSGFSVTRPMDTID